MGCLSQKSRSSKARNNHSDPVLPSLKHEIEELAELPLRAKQDSADLVALVELTIRCSDLPGLSASPPCAAVLCYQETAE